MRRAMWSWRAAKGPLVRTWMATGAVLLGLATSPTYVLAMQPQGGLPIPMSPRRADVTSVGRTPALPPPADSCPEFAANATQETADALAFASQGATMAEMRSRIPAHLRATYDAVLAGAWRFDRALFPNRNQPLDQAPVYVLLATPREGEPIAAWVNDGTNFSATLETMDPLDLAEGLQHANDPTLALQPGDAAWSVTGVGSRNGVTREFTGMVVSAQTPGGAMTFLHVSDDSICREPQLLTMSSTGGTNGCAPPDYVIPPGIPDIAWPEFPGIAPGHPCWDYDCIAQKVAAYRNAVQTAINTLAAAIQAIRDNYNTILITIRTTQIIMRIIQAIKIINQIRNCWWLGLIGPWAIAACIAAVIAYHIAFYIVTRMLFQQLKQIAINNRDWLIRQAILAFQWAVYIAFQTLRNDLLECWDPNCHPPEYQPPQLPQIPQPPWWPVDPNGPYKPQACLPTPSDRNVDIAGPGDVVVR